jgi:23S rRNA (guanosine2251-2'-O)-methyltransferase
MARKERNSSGRPERRPPAKGGGGAGGAAKRGAGPAKGRDDRGRPGAREERVRPARSARDDRGRPVRAARPAREAPDTERPRRGRMVIYGRNAVREALRGPRRVHRIWATEAAAREGWGGAPLTIMPAEEIEAKCGSDGHQGVCAEVDPYSYVDAAELLAAPDQLIVALDEVTDPQNLGAICRTAECAGATGVVVPERRSAEVTPAVCKASAGAVEHLRIARVRNLADFLAEAKAAGCWSYGAAAGTDTLYTQPDYTGGVVMVLGAEGRGLRPRVAAACDGLVSLPLRGRVESLNVSATAAVLVYEILHQRLDRSP